jgi:AP2 domain.
MRHFNETHGHTKDGEPTSEYTTWCAIKARCHCPGSGGYEKYGAKGISVCERWRESFEAFLSDMGAKPGPEYSIDRYPDGAGNYQPGNCRWATLVEQANNVKTNRKLIARGETRTMAEWSRVSGVDADTIWKRLDLGWSDEDAIFSPVRKASGGVSGVSWVAKRGKWAVSIRRNKKSYFLGRYSTLFDAACALFGNAARNVEGPSS